MAASELGRILTRFRQSAARAGGDAELLERFLSRGDESAFEVLVWRHGAMVLNLCRRVVRHEHDAEDAFQATFLALARKGGTIGRRETIAGWLYRVAFRVALRARERQAKWPMPLEQEPRRDGGADALMRELRRVIDDEVNRLPPRYRAAFVLCHLEGRTRDQAARELGLPRGTVDSRLAWALARLRGRLTRRGVGVAALAALAGEATAVPPRLVETVAQAAAAFAAGGSAALTGAVSEPVARLTHEAVRTMSGTKLRLGAAVALVAMLFGLGTSWFATPTHADPPTPAMPKTEQADATWREVWDVSGPSKDLRALAFSPDGRWLAAGGESPPNVRDGVALFDMQTGRESSRQPAAGSVRGLAFSPGGAMLVMADGTQVSCIPLNRRSKELDRYSGWIGLANKGVPSDQVAVSADGHWMAVGWRDGSVGLFDLPTGKEVWTARILEDGLGDPNAGGLGEFDPIHHFAFSRDGRLLATGGQRRICLWDTTSRKITRTFDPKAVTTWVDLSPDSKRMVTVCNGSPRLWDLATAKWVRLGPDTLPTIRVVQFSPDGKLIACGDANDWTASPNKVRLFDGTTGKPVAELPGHAGSIWALAFSPDGKLLASADAAGRVKAWQRGPRPAGQPLVSDRLDQLVDQLIKANRGDAQVIEGLFLAALGRLPTDAEVHRGLDEVARHKDRRDGLAAVLEALTRSEEYSVHLAELGRRTR
ncbi:MAG: sigma-70 family RNA polymerase sigma factor [Gemmataceae bacterium]